MRTRSTTACLLLLLAAPALGGCRTRLPVAPVSAPSVASADAPEPAARPSALAAFLHGGGAERTSTDPLGPFLAEVQPDRLQDMVRMELLTDTRRGPFRFLTDCACVCVPGRDHQEVPTRRLRGLPDWILFTTIAAGIGLVWWVAVVILPGEGWGRPGRVTAFGLVALVVFLVLALVLHRSDWRKMEQDRIRRKRRMRS